MILIIDLSMEEDKESCEMEVHFGYDDLKLVDASQ